MKFDKGVSYKFILTYTGFSNRGSFLGCEKQSVDEISAIQVSSCNDLMRKEHKFQEFLSKP